MYTKLQVLEEEIWAKNKFRDSKLMKQNQEYKKCGGGLRAGGGGPGHGGQWGGLPFLWPDVLAIQPQRKFEYYMLSFQDMRLPSRAETKTLQRADSDFLLQDMRHKRLKMIMRRRLWNIVWQQFALPSKLVKQLGKKSIWKGRAEGNTNSLT